MKILFLDDDHSRHIYFQRLLNYDKHEITVAYTSKQAIEKLKLYEFDIVYLDHDLGGQMYQDSKEGTGFEVAQFISKNINNKSMQKIIIHSYNSVGAQNMLNELYGFNVKYVPYNQEKLIQELND